MTVLPTFAGAIGALAITVGSVFTRYMARPRAALEGTGGILTARAGTVGAGAAASGRIRALHVAGGRIAAEVARAVLTTRTLAVGARAYALVVVTATLDVTGWSFTLEFTICARQADT